MSFFGRSHCDILKEHRLGCDSSSAMKGAGVVNRTLKIRTAIILCFYLLLIDLPRVLSMPVQVYLPRGMEAFLECPVDANPRPISIAWARDSKTLALQKSGRLRQRKDGALLFKSVTSQDEGIYTCTPYSVIGAGRTSPKVHIYVRGK